jgi:hypothetical protein
MNTDFRPQAADFMSDELDCDSNYDYYDDNLSDYDSDYRSDLDFDSEESYDSFNSTKIFDMKEHCRSLELNRLRLLIQGKYELEEGEILMAFELCSDDEQAACELAIAYIRILDGYQNACDLDDVSNFILDTVDNLKLNSAQALEIHAVLMSQVILNSTFEKVEPNMYICIL